MKDPNDFTCNDARPLVPLYLDGELTPGVGSERTGRFLRAAHKAPAPPTRQGTGKATTLTAGTGTATTGKEALAHVN